MKTRRVVALTLSIAVIALIIVWVITATRRPFALV